MHASHPGQVSVFAYLEMFVLHALSCQWTSKRSHLTSREEQKRGLVFAVARIDSQLAKHMGSLIVTVSAVLAVPGS